MTIRLWLVPSPCGQWISRHMRVAVHRSFMRRGRNTLVRLQPAIRYFFALVYAFFGLAGFSGCWKSRSRVAIQVLHFPVDEKGDAVLDGGDLGRASGVSIRKFTRRATGCTKFFIVELQICLGRGGIIKRKFSGLIGHPAFRGMGRHPYSNSSRPDVFGMVAGTSSFYRFFGASG